MATAASTRRISHRERDPEYYLFREPEEPGEDDDFEVLPEDRVVDLAEPLSTPW